MGSATRLDNGRTLIGWGGLHNPAVTEVTNDGTKTFEMIFDESVFSYRAFRQSWRTNLLIADRYNIDFGFVAISDTAVEQITITNNSNEVKVTNSFFLRTDLFNVVDEFPISLQPFESKIFQIQFFPDSIGVFSDDIHLRIDEENEMIAQVISVSGFSDPFIPIELVYFNAVSEPGKVILNWSTATETNNLGYYIQRTSELPPAYQGGGGEPGGGWKNIGFVEGKGTTTQTSEYLYIDNIFDIKAQTLIYRLKQIDLDGSYKYSEEVLVENMLTTSFILHQNFPNPFNPSTKINYTIPALSAQRSVAVKLIVYDVLGNKVATLINEAKSPGIYDIEFSRELILQSGGGKLSSGIYFYQLSAGEFIETKKMVIIR
ncbi:MAG: T9SS type A sorting domain-containing protein [Ignavibacterium sp.]|nr:MAG: T9SS type A sorting domain-containing protein [Ignavibacterium sp.]